MSFDHRPLEASCLELWAQMRPYAFQPDGPGEIFAVDTPPPYVSAAHLHVGHAMSYAQAEFVVRWHRMKGRRVFYPMGFDDNGLPTERYVEHTLGVDKTTVSRSAFRAHCLEETQRGAKVYTALWRAMGLSVDWSLQYSTIDQHCQRTAQRSFLDLLATGRVYRSHDPVMWDPVLQTSVAQADLETLSRRQKLHTLYFQTPDGTQLPIATTRPELLLACVALYHHPDDSRYRGLTEAILPLQARRVPVHTDGDVDPEFGSGLMMVCTFGDAEDVRRWRRDQLATRMIVQADGTLGGDAGKYQGLDVASARRRVVADLESAGQYGGFTMVEQAVPIAERSQAPIEWRMIPQWFLRILDKKSDLKKRAGQLRWHPQFMKDRLDQWIDGLQWDWCLSRQRYYGVPIPVWFCKSCAAVHPASGDALPVDPCETSPPGPCESCGGELYGDPDVLDTWMTSSMTPMINANWVDSPGRTTGPLPMTVRVQAFEIIRTWLFYTLLKSDLHLDQLPWRDVMISGWGLNEQGRKISKRDLMRLAASGELNRYDPGQVIEQYGADALRHWAAKSQLGQNLRYNLKDVKAGRRIVVKLWNAARLIELLGQADRCPPLAERPIEDRDVRYGLDQVVQGVNEGFASYDYASGLMKLDRYFLGTVCDDWLETIKPRVQQPERFGAHSRASAQTTAREVLRILLGLYAPYLPFVTEAIFQRQFATDEPSSLHVTRFPEAENLAPAPEMNQVREVLREVRSWRTELRLPQSRPISRLTLAGPAADRAAWMAREPTLLAACRAANMEWSESSRLVDGRDVAGIQIHAQFASGSTR